VNPEKEYPFLTTLLSAFRKTRRTTLGLMIAAIAATGQARSFAIATTVAAWLGIRLDSAVNRFYRLLRNDKVDYAELATRWLDLLVRRGDRQALIAIDWTEWHRDLRLLVAALVTGRRGIPILVQGFRKLVAHRSQNTRENHFLRQLAAVIHVAKVEATILCDRGFRRTSWLNLLSTLRLHFVVRLMSDVHVEIEAGMRQRLADILLVPGQILDLGVVALRSDGAAAVRVIGYWAPGAHEPWWIATSRTDSARAVLALYDRRMTVEEQFRDTKGKRFGAKLAWTQFRDPVALAHFVTLLAVALLIWTLAGIVAARRDPSLRLRCKYKGPRQSFVTIGVRATALGPPAAGLNAGRIRRLLQLPELRALAALAGAK
jgi:hypothetical protein